MRSKLIKCVFIMCCIGTMLSITPKSTHAFQLIKQNQVLQYDHLTYPLQLKKVYIQLLPEYDKPSNWDKNKPNVLVSLSGDLVNTSNIEYQDYVYVQIPTEGSLFTLSLVSETKKGMFAIPYEVVDGYVRWKPSQSIGVGERYSFTVEYHFDPIEVYDTGVRELTFTYKPEVIVAELNIDVYMPQYSSEHYLIPSPQSDFIINNGINVYSYSYNEVDTNRTIELKVQYTNASIRSTDLAKASPSNDFFHASINSDFIGIIIFSLILIIIGFSVIALSLESKKRKAYYFNSRRDLLDIVFDENQLRKKELQKLLIQGKINEETYKLLLDEEEYRNK